MFIASRAIDDRSTAYRVADEYRAYTAATDTWFDGSPDSVDARLRHARRILSVSQAAVSRRGASAGPLRLIAELDSDIRALTALRHDLLTGAYDREDHSPIAGVRVADISTEMPDAPEYVGGGVSTSLPGAVLKLMGEGSTTTGQEPPVEFNPGPRAAALAPEDRRFVTLESSKFLADNTDTYDVRELATRAEHFAQRATSTYIPDRSRAITSAFVGTVAALAHRRRNAIAARIRGELTTTRTASVSALPAEAMFI